MFAETMQVKRGDSFVGALMENRVMTEGAEDSDAQQVSVEFMIVPGFRVGRNVIKSRVYVKTTNCCPS